MSPEVALLSETWQLFKNHIHVKERIEMAESLLELFEEHIDIDDLDAWKNEFDRSMKVAIRSRYEDVTEDDSEDW